MRQRRRRGRGARRGQRGVACGDLAARRGVASVHAVVEWPEEMLMLRDAVKQFVDKEIRPNVDDLEHGDLPPYDLLRKLYATFGMDAMAKASFERRMEREIAGDSESGEADAAADVSEMASGGG